MMSVPRYAGQGLRHVFLRDMMLGASIGVYAHERTALQRIRVNVDLAVAEHEAGLSHAMVGRDDLGRVLDYEAVVHAVRGVVAAGHVQLVETLAERIAETCLLDARVVRARIRIEKLDVFADLAAVGVEIERERASCPPGPVDLQ